MRKIKPDSHNCLLTFWLLEHNVNFKNIKLVVNGMPVATILISLFLYFYIFYLLSIN